MDPLENWLRGIPHSRLARPTSLAEWAKYSLWKVLTPLHPYVRDLLTRLGFVHKKYQKFRPNGRQHYLIGRLAPTESVQSVTEFLVSQGFGNHFVALKDEGELVGLRYTPSFKHQYHVRIFNDGEVRGHFEYTTECHPFIHNREIGEEHREEFLALFGERIIPL